MKHVAKSETDVRAPIAAVWAALTDAETLGREGTPFEDRGVILELTEPTTLRVSHETPGSDATHEVRYDLRELGPDATHVTLTQDGNASVEAAEQAAANGQAMLEALQHETGHTT